MTRALVALFELWDERDRRYALMRRKLGPAEIDAVLIGRKAEAADLSAAERAKVWRRLAGFGARFSA
jgi:hypothetical protein